MIRAMVVDDSPLVRKIASDILNNDPGIEVVATAATAEFALSKLERERPDVITMDMEMPGMGGLAAIQAIMSRRPTPIIVLSAHARRGADLTLQALEAGAVDFMLKPAASLSGGLDAVARELVEKVKGARGIDMKSIEPAREPAVEPASSPTLSLPAEDFAAVPPRRPVRLDAPGRYELIALGTSTGGPVALKSLLCALPEGFPVPVVVVQHMPPVFTKAFAERLDSICSLSVKEAEDGDRLVAGRVFIAPGDHHLVVLRYGAESKVQLNQREPVSGHRPSVDVLMHSVAREYGPRAVGVIMTGMGKDGAGGIHELKQRGGYILAQDRHTSVIFGMNREVIMNGDADEVLPIQAIAGRLVEAVREKAIA
jgi:two-component system chemotaxis response regulator CheB